MEWPFHLKSAILNAMTKVKVFLVEDDPQISKSLSLALSYIGFEMCVSETLAAARARLQDYRPDIFLLDVNLPDGNGLDFCHELRESGVDIARRTVAKYREALRIPSSVQRRREKQAVGA